MLIITAFGREYCCPRLFGVVVREIVKRTLRLGAYRRVL